MLPKKTRKMATSGRTFTATSRPMFHPESRARGRPVYRDIRQKARAVSATRATQRIGCQRDRTTWVA
jgi:hypothetical protein